MKEIKILFVCHGNICRSPMAESIMTHLAEVEGLPIKVASAATSSEAVGWDTHTMTKRVLKEKGIPLVPHISVKIKKEDYYKYDFLIGMDSANVRNMQRIMDGDPKNKISKLLDFTTERRDIDDPWYTDKYHVTYKDIMYGCTELLEYLKTNYSS